MKKIILLTGVIFIAAAIYSCGSDSTVNNSSSSGSNYIFQNLLVEYSGSVQGEYHIYKMTTKRSKISVDFTGETDAGTSNFIVRIQAMSDSNTLAPLTIYETSDQTELNKTHTVTSPDLTTLDPLYLLFSVSLSRPPSGTKFVRIKSVNVKEVN